MGKGRASNSKPSRLAIIVLGMHRSGTSALGGMLARLGVQPPKSLMVPTKDNPKGYWESVEIMKAHDQLLRSAGSRWNDWGAFNQDWLETPVADQFRETIPELIQREFGDARMMLIKDPRMCRFLPLWLDALAEMKIEPRILIPLRHPLEVATSLAVRDHFGRDRSLLLWLRHVLDAEVHSRPLRRSFLRYEDLLNDWRAQARKISDDLDLKWPRMSPDTEADLGQFLGAELRHHQAAGMHIGGNPELAAWTGEAYEILNRFCDGPAQPADLAALDAIRARFDQTAGIYAPVVREHETRVEALYADTKRRLKDKSDEHDAAVAQLQDAQQRLQDAAQREAEFHSSKDSMSAQHTNELLTLSERLTARERDHHDLVARHEVAMSGVTHQMQMQVAELARLADSHRLELQVHQARHETVSAQRDALGERLGQAEHRVAELQMAMSSQAAELAARVEAERAEALKLREAVHHEQVRQAELRGEMQGLVAQQQQREAELRREMQDLVAQQQQREAELRREMQDLVAQQQQCEAERTAQAQQDAQVIAGLRADMERSRAALADAEQTTRLQCERTQAAEDELARVRATGLENGAARLAEMTAERDAQKELARALEASKQSRFQEIARLTLMVLDLERTAAKHEEHVARLEFELAFHREHTQAFEHALEVTAARAESCRNQLNRSLRGRARRVASRLGMVQGSGPEPFRSGLPSLDAQAELIRDSGLLDPDWYLERYPAAAESGMDPARHYLRRGAVAGFNPGPDFDTFAYVLRYPDVRCSGINPLVHYLQHGRDEGRTIQAAGASTVGA